MQDKYYLKKTRLHPVIQVPYCKECNEKMEPIPTTFTYKDVYKCTGCNLKIKVSNGLRIINYEQETEAPKEKIAMRVSNKEGEFRETAYINLPKADSKLRILWPKGHYIEPGDIVYSEGDGWKEFSLDVKSEK